MKSINGKRKGPGSSARRAAKTTTVTKQKTTRTVRSSQRPRQQNVDPSALTRQVCSLVDPFCQAALGAKFPDISSVRSMPYQHRTSFSVTTDAGGNFGGFILPGWNSVWCPGNNPLLFPQTFGVMVSAGAPNLTPNSYRIISMGFIARNTATPLSSSGLVRIRGFSTLNGGALGTVDVGTYSCDFSNDTPLQDTHETAVFLRRTHATAADFTRPTVTSVAGANISTWVSPGWGPVCVAVIGGPVSSTCLNLELIINYELIFDDNDSLQLACTPAAPDNGVVSAAASHVQSTVVSVITSGLAAAATIIERKAKSALMGAIAARLNPGMLMLT